MTLAAGAHVGPYEVLSLLGSGGMGQVWMAEDHRLNRFVALKTLNRDRADAAVLRRRLQGEGRAAAATPHPNILAIYDIGEHDGTSYIVTELARGGTLSSRMRGRPLAVDALLDIAIPIAEGLAAAHRDGIVHRDIKPENIVFLDSGVPKISDFGLAKRTHALAGSVSTSTDIIGGGVVAGTAAYMSPEQARGEVADFASDQFSFGSMLYEMATGVRPFERESFIQTLNSIIEDAPSFDRWPAQFPPMLKNVVQRCLEKDPVRRYASTDDLARDLKTIRQSSPYAPSMFAKFFERRHATAFLLALALMISAGAVVMRARRRIVAAPVLAVLPFRSLPPSASTSHLGIGITDAIIGRLSEMQELIVRPTSAIAQYEHEPVSPAVAGRKVGAAFVLSGMFSAADKGNKVEVELTDVRRDRVIWRDRFGLPEGELFLLPDSTATRIAKVLQLTITPRLGGAHERPVSDTALEDYLSIRASLAGVGRGGRPGQLQALERLNAILAREPDFARALGARAFVEASLNFWEPSSRWYSAGMSDGERALALDPHLVEPHLARSSLLNSSLGGWKIFDAVQETRRAVAFAPGNELARQQLTSLYRHLGWFDLLRSEADALEQISPQAAALPRLRAMVLMDSGMSENSLALYASVRPLPNDPFPVWQQIATASLYCGRTAQALTESQRHYATESDDAPERPLTAALLAVAKLRSGDRNVAELEKEALSTDQRMGHFHHVLIALAELHALEGDARRALDYLARAADEGMPCLTCFENDPFLINLRATDEYRAFAENLRARQTAFLRASSAVTGR
jgi:TolB-like protein/tetratricopeptide (TPR) repeat protein